MLGYVDSFDYGHCGRCMVGGKYKVDNKNVMKIILFSSEPGNEGMCDMDHLKKHQEDNNYEYVYVPEEPTTTPTTCTDSNTDFHKINLD